jgi:hypothetical protein
LRFGSRDLPSSTLAWALVVALVLVVGALWTGWLSPRDFARQGQSESGSYVAATAKLREADASQQLHMQLEGQFPGPLADTVVQRWRDPVDGTVCYIYLPAVVAHAPGPQGLVQYGSANIGSISCLAAHPAQ